MIFRQKFLDGIRDGTITLAFRRWRRPSVRSGGTLLTAAGQLSITSVDEVVLTRISEADARRAGYASREALLAELQARDEGKVYRIELGALRVDPRCGTPPVSIVVGDGGRARRRLVSSRWPGFAAVQD
jgi:hypothetical protein